MKNMNAEIFSTLSIILLCWIVLLVTDAAVCGLLRLLAGIRFRTAFVWGCLSLLIPPLAIAWGALVERNMFRVKKVEVVCSTLPEAFDGYRIIHISDIHARSFEGREKRVEKAVERMNALEADMVAFTGDLITTSPEELDIIGGILGGLRAKDGVFSVLGNHDYSMYSDMRPEDREKAMEELMNIQKEMGWTLLMNENRTIRHGKDSIAVVGVENTSPSRHFPSKGDLPQAASGTEGMFRILLSHDPLHWEAEVVGQDYPLTLSGHTHAMQFSIFGWSPSRLMFPHYRGLYSKGTQYIYVNPGLGETIFPARIGVRPEITLITLKARNYR